MERTVIHHLKLAESMNHFIHQEGPRKGKAILNKPYWVKLDDAWWFDFIRPDMDMVQFKQNMSAKSVYVLDDIKDLKL